MCIIIYKPAEATAPTKKTLKTCFLNNPDGAGFMYNADGFVHIRKGFKTFTNFYKNIRQALADHPAAAFVLHFRIGTQGPNAPELTHPYPLADNYNAMRLLSCRCWLGVAHNGVISAYSNYSIDANYNDSMTFIKDFLSVIIKNKNYYNDQRLLQVIKKTCGSRLALLDADGHCELIGDNWTKSGGCFYSNTSFLSYKITPSKTIKNFSYLGDKDWDKYYNEKTQLYDFNTWDCPYTDGDDGFCYDCANFEKCFYYDSAGGDLPD